MHGDMANSQGELEENATAQYEVEYHGELKQLFEDDSSNESYKTPFSNPEDLMAHFVELEENNLSLIQQWQENEQQTEIKRKDLEKVKTEKTKEIDTLLNTVEENKEKNTKIKKEKYQLELVTSKGSENLMDQATYNKVTDEISDIRKLVDKKRAKGTNVPDATMQLVEIETHINGILKMLELAKRADPVIVDEKMRVLRDIRRNERQ